jgi:phage terminase small subunit
MADESPKQLNSRQTLFLSFYLGECQQNATRAAQMAGYKKPLQQGPRLLGNVGIRAAIEEWRADVKRLAITQVNERLAVLDDIKRKYLQIISERADAYAKEQNAPGASTGLLVRQEKVIGSGDAAMHIVEWKADTAITDAIQKLDEQAAKELGQWTEKVDVSGAIERTFVLVTDDAA